VRDLVAEVEKPLGDDLCQAARAHAAIGEHVYVAGWANAGLLVTVGVELHQQPADKTPAVVWKLVGQVKYGEPERPRIVVDGVYTHDRRGSRRACGRTHILPFCARAIV
jgi:hypothetical protein